MTLRSRIAGFIAFVLAALGSAAYGQPCPNYASKMFEVDRDFLGINGPVALELSGSHLWALKSSASYRVFDVSDPSDPVLLGDVSTSARVWDVEVEGNLGYFVTDATLTVYDVTDPASPTFLGTTAVPDHARGLTLAGDRALVTTLSSLQVFDVSDPSDPTSVATVAVGGYADGVADGDIVYFGTTLGLRVWSVATPSSPVLIGQSAELLSITRVEKHGDIVFGIRLGATGGIAAWDVSDPSAPTTQQILPIADGNGVALTILEDHAFVSVATPTAESFRSIDVSDPSDMQPEGTFHSCDAIAFPLFDLVSVGDYVLAGFEGTVRTYDVSSPTFVDPTFELTQTERKLRSIDVAGDWLTTLEYYRVPAGYGYDEYTRYQLFDVSDPDAPSSFFTSGAGPGSYSKIRTDGTTVALVGDEGVVIHSTLPIYFARDVLLFGGYAWVTRASSGFATVEVGFPSAILTYFPTSGALSGVALLGPAIAVGDAVDGLLIVSTQPFSPTLLTTNSDAGPLGELVTEGDFLYARSPDGSTVHVFDTSNFLAPQLLSSIGGLQPGKGLEVQNGVVFAIGENGAQVVDATDPYAPYVSDIILNPCRTSVGVAGGHGRVYVGSTIGDDTAMFTYLQGFPGPCEVTSTAAPIVASRPSGLGSTPNPFRASTSFSFGVDRADRFALSIFDVAGRRVRRVDAGLLEPGSHRLTWDGLDPAGRPVPAGVYFVRLEGGAKNEVARVVRLR